MEKSILVTGCAGFLGSHLSEALAEKNYVIGIDNLFRGKYVPKNIKFYKLDLAEDYNSVLKILKENSVEIVIHYAAINGTKYFYDIPYKVFTQNVAMTKNILKASVETNVKYFVYASSSEVYGEPLQIPTPETHPIILEVENERDSYAASKAFGEFYTRLTSNEFGLKYLILRIFNTYGPRMDTSEYGQVIPEFIRKLLKEDKFTIYGSGQQTRAFLYVEDHVRFVLKLINKKVENEIVNVGSDKEIKIIEVAKILHELVGKKFKPEFLPERKGDRKRRCPDISKLKRLIDDEPKFSLKEGLKKTLKWYVDQWNINIEIKD